MASKSTAPSLVEKIGIPLSLSLDESNQHGLGPTSPDDYIKIHVPTYVFSSELPTESPDDKIVTLATLAEDDYHRVDFNFKKGPDTATPSAPRYYCAVVTLSTEGDWMVSFMLQVSLTMEEEEAINLVMKLVAILCSMLKWNDHLVLPHSYTGDPYPGRVERSIGEKSETQIKEWRDKTAENIEEKIMEGLRYRSSPKSHEAVAGAGTFHWFRVSARMFPV
ncbi:hypothetical protein RAB80_018306 [Fusarium oxysporum f. sp. vasinfectum]|uniref:Uncharacterized protein n=1 Tax=Fusarium oxysporum f. sp. vasinfectum 25433 TaxID=1089449 RepID=X0M893_FUSOX|nr:hypothetical protein FOTG_14900 [Fusarium oxysporum f. sp. vasinfectum 25433]KAK2666206.1 hypothetical protein RAB80_018306 [Fusarium oxysporum f. sp. vasinfectum]KAK2922381.1 hypothetical protein FoTM2_017737 [Fusarium oxysporum f. sp. vasinfectum]